MTRYDHLVVDKRERTDRAPLEPHCLQKASVMDIPSIVPLVNAAFAVETFINGPRTDYDEVRRLMDSGTFLVAKERNGETVAAVYAEIGEARGYFGMLAVNPDRQGTGLGRAMVYAAEEHLRQHGCERVDITVLNLRTELFPFYTRLGYTVTGTADYHKLHALKPGVVCVQIVMSKPLRPAIALD
jgi:ribosomal protein S18 acetylase RimI-like enzyme